MFCVLIYDSIFVFGAKYKCTQFKHILKRGDKSEVFHSEIEVDQKFLFLITMDVLEGVHAQQWYMLYTFWIS